MSQELSFYGRFGKVTLILFVCFLIPASTMHGASVLFDNGDPGFDNAFVSDPQFPIQYGNDFTLTASDTITGLSWFGDYKMLTGSSPNVIGPDNFTVAIFGIANGIPDTIPLLSVSGLSGNRVATGNSLPYPGENEFAYQVSLSAVIPAGTYLLSIVNQTVSGDDLWLWSWSDQSWQIGKALYSRTNDGDPWYGPSTTQVSFRLFGNSSSDLEPVTLVPEPRSWGLAAIGLLGALTVGQFLSKYRLVIHR